MSNKMQSLLSELSIHKPTLYKKLLDETQQVNIQNVRKEFRTQFPKDVSTVSIASMLQKLLDFSEHEILKEEPNPEKMEETLVEVSGNDNAEPSFVAKKFDWKDFSKKIEDIFLLEQIGQSEPELRAEQQAEYIVANLQDIIRDNTPFDISVFESVSKNQEFLFWVQVAQASNL